MTPEGALVSILKADAGVTAIAAGRIHPVSDPQPGYPKITLQRIDTDRSAASGGFTNDGPTLHATAHLQLDCWAADLLTAKQLARAVRLAINGYSGAVSDLTVNCVYISDEREQPGTVYPGQEKGLQRVILDARMTFADN